MSVAMITLYGFGPALGLIDPSPFVLKMDAYLRFAELEYRYRGNMGHLFKAPKSRLPYIEDNGEVIADSWFIIQHLRNQYGLDLDDWLRNDQRALCELIKKALEEQLYWCVIHYRWVREDSWKVIKPAFFDQAPFPMRYIAPIMARRQVKAALSHHGMGSHSDQEILELANVVLKSVSTLLGEEEWFFGGEPSSLDATLFGLLAQMLLSDVQNPMSELARSFPNLVYFTERVAQQYYPDEFSR